MSQTDRPHLTGCAPTIPTTKRAEQEEIERKTREFLERGQIEQLPSDIARPVRKPCFNQNRRNPFDEAAA